MGAASISMLPGSPVGVATAAKMVMPRTIPRHQEPRRLAESTPVMLRRTRTSGSSKARPKTITILITRSR